MENISNSINIQNFTTENGVVYHSLPLTFTISGLPLHSAPIVLVNHALTGNAEVTGENGWWNDLIGPDRTIDTNIYTVLAFNVPGNGNDTFFIENYQDFTARDIARIFIKGLKLLDVEQVHTIIGGSVGGGIAWEILALEPNITQNLIPIATDWKSTDWMIANCYLQEQILNNSSKPIEDARIHAMLCYRSPESFKEKFQRTINENLSIFNIESWLAHHGEKLQKRYQLSSYKLMNQLLKTIDITRNSHDFKTLMSKTNATIHIIGINSDLFFTPKENRETYEELKRFKDNVYYSEIDSIHGHDAFLIEYKQLDHLLADIFKAETIKR
ncbi:alpha/beta fold hydrolase [Flavobacterium sp. MC2016-06]|uniref:alpha/beta fold hydrolase n=1 Tax=Flavobacterium sp. MC2016-06 TaxID=2676308 RepID=UPI0012BA57D6|nr:alpha/beta fold hydrolase [Flavobacterium sp. MC2016-06]MBU3858049.1 alpha/beta fold hydrolase [Flavobacterium sp. MC2016-06]